MRAYSTPYEHLLHVLEEHRIAVTDRVLQRPKEILLGQLDHFETDLGAEVAHPTVSLALRVDHQWPPSAHCRKEAIFGAEE